MFGEKALLTEFILDKRKIERKTTAPHAQAANLFLQIGKPDEALNHINETLKARPDFPPFMMIKARCFLMKGEDNLAVPILEQLLSLRPYDPNIIARLAQAYHGAGKTAQAKDLLVSAINLSMESRARYEI